VRDRLGVTGLIVTHSRACATQCGDRIGILDGGRIALEGTVAEMTASDHPLARAFLGGGADRHDSEQRMEENPRATPLGIVFIGTMASLLWASINLTDVSFNNVAPLKVAVPDGGGVRAGDSVLLLGKRVGKVTDIDILWQKAQNRVQLTLAVRELINFR